MGKGGKGKGGKGGKGFAPMGPPEWVECVGEATHTCEDQLIVKCQHTRVPKFSTRLFLENKEEIGTMDEIFGPINDYMFSVKMAEGMKASSFKPGSKIFIDPQTGTLPFDMFLPKAAGASKGGKGKGGKGKGGKGKDGGKGKGKGKGGKGKGVAKGGAKGGAFTGRGGASKGSSPY